MQKLNTEATLRACASDDAEALVKLVPVLIGPNARVQHFRMGDRPYSAVPFLCVCAAYGSEQCFEYLIEHGAISYYADLVCYIFISIQLHYITPAATDAVE